MAPVFKISHDPSPPVTQEGEMRVPTAGTWLGLAAGILVVAASFVWTIL